MRLQPFDQVVVSAFEKKLHVLDSFLVMLERRETFDTRPEASVNVVLQTGSWTPAVDLNVAVADEEITFDQLQRFASQTCWEEWTEVCGAVFANASCDNGTRTRLVDRELYIRIGFVVTQEDVVFRLTLFDEIIFKRECFSFCVGDDKLHVLNAVHHLVFSGVEIRGELEVRSHAVPQ